MAIVRRVQRLWSVWWRATSSLGLGEVFMLCLKKSKLLGIYILPTIEDIAKDIARRDKARIVPTGLYAMNMLGLTTQVPLKAVYLTDGAPRKKNNQQQSFGIQKSYSKES